MRLTLTREYAAPTWTLGQLRVYGVPGIPDGAGEIWTCEDVDRGLDVSKPETLAAKIHGQTAIPTGVYQVTITRSKRFGRDLPLLLSVPGFAGIRIHPGNSAADTEGCLLLGSARDTKRGLVSGSRVTCDLVHGWIAAALDRGETVSIEVRRAP